MSGTIYRYLAETYYVVIMIAIFMLAVSLAMYIYSFIHAVYGLPCMWGKATAFLMNGLAFYALASSIVDITPHKIRGILVFNMLGLVFITTYTVVAGHDYMDVALALIALLTSVVALALFSYSVEKSRVIGGGKTNGYYHQ
ncbi:MAG: hypothetical protein GXO43_04210 [Crenarchaeota archaeon]|nr:hypothetical protein [Thermoproteota archaeon]